MFLKEYTPKIIDDGRRNNVSSNIIDPVCNDDNNSGDDYNDSFGGDESICHDMLINNFEIENELSTFGIMFNLLMAWTSEETIFYFKSNDPREKSITKQFVDDIPTVDGSSVNLSRRKAFVDFSYPCLSEISTRLQLPYLVHNSFYLCVATFNFSKSIPTLSKQTWLTIVFVILNAVSFNENMELVLAKIDEKKIKNIG